jgi:hypothetical protein
MRWLKVIGRWGGLILAGVGFVLGLLLARRRPNSLPADAARLARDRTRRAREQAQNQLDEAVRQASAETDDDRRRAEEARRADPDRTLSDCFDELDASAERWASVGARSAAAPALAAGSSQRSQNAF